VPDELLECSQFVQEANVENLDLIAPEYVHVSDSRHQGGGRL
jgi:hypothetical protein